MNNDLPSVRTTVMVCTKCGTRTTASYHDDLYCDGLVIEVDGTLQCAECSVQITPSATCSSCGATATTDTTQSVVSLRQQIPSNIIGEELSGQIKQRYSKPLKNDITLSAIASQYVSTIVEQSYVESVSTGFKLSDHVDTHLLTIGGYQTYSLEIYPNGETAATIASEIYEEFLTDFPDRDSEFTHLGISLNWNPRGGLYGGIIAAKRLVSLPNEIDPAKLERSIHDATNERRTTHNYCRLSYNRHLCGVARSHSRAMATHGFFAHESPDGVKTMERYQRANYNGHRAGENIAKQYIAASTETETIATDVVNDWMNSPGHRENILNANFETEGIGVYQGDDGALFVTQNFG